MFKKIKSLYKNFIFNEKVPRELLMAEIFNNSISGVDWLKSKSFSPSGGAANYSFLYILFRVLNNVQPSSIIEFGIGETSKLTSQYVIYKRDDTSLCIIEHDKNWIDMLKRSISSFKNISILNLDVITAKFKSYDTFIYADLGGRIKDAKFDLIIVDGFAAKRYSRIYVLDLIPNHIKDSFVIIVDDYDRRGERDTVTELINKLKSYNIEYDTAFYVGIIKQCVIYSKDLYFLKTL